MRTPAGRTGFTLMELLVSVVLMVILLSAVTLVFMRTTETVAMSQARTTVYTNARYAMDVMENDLLGCLPFTSGQQKFILQNGRTMPPSNPPAVGGGFHVGQAADFIKFRATAPVGNRLQTAEISYHLIPGNRALAIPGPTALPDALNLMPLWPPGDPDRGQTVRTPSRPIYTLVRRVRVQNAQNPANWDQVAVDSFGNAIPDMEVCYFVVSFNIEYLANNMSFSQIDAGPAMPGGSPCPPNDPLGDGAGLNDGIGAGAGVALRIPALRITLVIVEDVGARQERQIQKEIWIPMG
ncbi:MAG: prepilin-type N-terminal cleavage/methylation domain-containing protein [Planctomycetes bacterium]|nr:prepilin-type N-terminal cleavage/methylation domain-containing protein [Planctomycetota bacterium]